MTAITRGVKNLWWYLGALVGEHDYDNYVAHLQACHPDAHIPTKGEFWRARYAAQDANPEGRCC